VDVSFFVFLFGLSYIFEHMQRPLQKAWKEYPKGRFPAVLCLGILLVAFDQVLVELDDGSLPAVYRHFSDMVDFRLDFASPDGRGAVINPSLVVVDDPDDPLTTKVHVAARVHWLSSKQEADIYVGEQEEYQGKLVTRIDNVWHSKLVVGDISLSREFMWNWPTTAAKLDVPLKSHQLTTAEGESWTRLCRSDVFIPENMTVIRKIVTGPEDPRLTLHNGRIVLSINSVPPVIDIGFGDSYADACPVTVSQMYNAYLYPAVEQNFFNPTFVTPNYLEYGRKQRAEKNWISFSHGDQLYYVYSLFPHIIAVSDPADGRVANAFETSFNPLLSLSRMLGDAELRGSAQAVFVEGSEALTPNYPFSHYLAMFHAHDENTNRYVILRTVLRINLHSK